MRTKSSKPPTLLWCNTFLFKLFNMHLILMLIFMYILLNVKCNVVLYCRLLLSFINKSFMFHLKKLIFMLLFLILRIKIVATIKLVFSYIFSYSSRWWSTIGWRLHGQRNRPFVTVCTKVSVISKTHIFVALDSLLKCL